MANLLPTAERQALAIERRWRLMSAVAILFGIVALAATALLVPSYIAARSTLSTTVRRIETTQRLIERQRGAGALAEIDALNERIDRLTDDDVHSATDIIERVIASMPSGVALHSLNWKHDETKDVLDISGSADTRASLIAFGDGLRATGLFADVSIPIESLAAQNDLQFRLSLALTK